MSGNIFRICTVTSEGLIRLDPATISPATACKRDPEAFLLFATEVVKVMERELEKKMQLNLALWGEEETSDIAAG